MTLQMLAADREDSKMQKTRTSNKCQVEFANPELLHAKLGAYYAREKYGVDDEDIRSAIEFHTTGRPAMSLLEKIVFVADYIEPNRKPLPEIDEIRNEAFSDIDASVAHILKNTLTYLDSGSCGDTDEMSVGHINIIHH